MNLKIVLNNTYLVFDIYNDVSDDENDFYESKMAYQDLPKIIIFKRDMSGLCYIEEEMTLDPKEKGMDDTYHYGLYSFTYFIIDKKGKKIRIENWSREEYFFKLSNDSFYATESIMERKGKVYTRLK